MKTHLRYVIRLEGESPQNKIIFEVNPKKPGIGLQIEELISVEQPVNEDLLLSGMDFYLEEIIHVSDKDFEEKKRKLLVFISHQAKPIGKYELSDEEKMLLIMTALGKPTKKIADKLGISDEALRKRKQRLLDRIGIKDKLMLKAWLKKEGILRNN